MAAVTSLGFSGVAADADVDALMVRNVGAGEEYEFADEILFSIRAVPKANFDGGEIIRLPSGGVPSFLVHGGHVWDTAFGVAAATGSSTEEIDAIQAYPSPATVPALGVGPTAAIGVLLAVSAAIVFRRRR